MDRRSSSSSSNNHENENEARRAERQVRRTLRRASYHPPPNDDDEDDDDGPPPPPPPPDMGAMIAAAAAAARNNRGQKRSNSRRSSGGSDEDGGADWNNPNNNNNHRDNTMRRPDPRGQGPALHLYNNNNREIGINHHHHEDVAEEDHEFMPPDHEAAANANPLRTNRMHAAAAAAAGAAGDPWLQSLVEHLRGIWAASDLGDDTPIDLQKARNVLEASAGNVSLAAQLYWDDFLANHSAAAAAAAAGAPRQQRARGHGGGEEESEHSRETDPEDDDDDEDDEMVEGAVRRVRRRLDDLMERGQADGPPRMAVAAAAAAAALGGGGGDAAGQGAAAANAPEAAAMQVALPERGQAFALMPLAAMDVGSVSVSDDETTGVSAWRAVGRLVSQVDDTWAENELIHRHRPRPPPPPPPPRHNQPQQPENVSANDQVDNTGLVEDDLVMFEAVNQLLEEPVRASALRSPTDLLWGMGPNRLGSERENSTSNVIAAEDEAPVVEVFDNMGIPRTWLNTGFHLSECGNGLVVKPPPKEELAFFTRRQQQNARGQPRNACPPPYHCRAITGIISLVTGLLYSGASIQGDQVNCSSAKTPFAELSKDDKKRQFQSRLADALSALLLVAAHASMERKKKALDKRRESNTADVGTIQKLEHKLRLFPTCWWEKDATTGETRLPDGQDPSQRVQVSVSLTNIQDLHTYVLSNMQFFMAPGGCALFMETILGIHGRNVIKLLLARARRHATSQVVATADALVATESLISCTCEERQKVFLQETKAPSGGNPSKLIDATPPGHECLSIELLSLLLTGEVHSTLHGWSAKHLGLGILSNKKDQVGWQLRHPERLIWIVRGPTCYSLLWQKEGHHKDHLDEQRSRTLRNEDPPGQVVELSHWNCWYAEQRFTDLRLMTARAAWAPPTIKANSKMSAASATASENKTIAGILERRRQAQQVQVVSAEEDDDGSHPRDKSGADKDDDDDDDDDVDISDDMLLDHIRIHPDDLKYYPNNFMLCRFDVGEVVRSDVGDEDRKPHAEHWTPFYRLSRRQRRLVRIKLGPKIIPILETRWPQAPMVQFVSGDGSHPIV